MNVLSVYNAYLDRGGEDEVFEAEADLLEQYGHRVKRFRVEPTDLINPSLLKKISLAGQTIWSSDYHRQIQELVRVESPSIVHFHNVFPLISPSAYAACQELGVPVIQTLHNYRLVCPNALFFRDGHSCEDCLGKTIPWPGVLHACYHNSHIETSIIAAMLATHRLRRTWMKDVDTYIALSDFSKGKFIAGGIPEHKISIKPNFLREDPGVGSIKREGMLFVGRLAGHKGIALLPEAWEHIHSNVSLRIVGDGPLSNFVQNSAESDHRIAYLGRQSKATVLVEMESARAVLVPSIYYETFGLTIIEAFAVGTPVIAARHGAIQDLVEHGRTGLLFEPGNAQEMASMINWAIDHPRELKRMGEAARREFEQKYTAQRNYDMLMGIYEQTITGSNHLRPNV